MIPVTRENVIIPQSPKTLSNSTGQGFLKPLYWVAVTELKLSYHTEYIGFRV